MNNLSLKTAEGYTIAVTEFIDDSDSGKAVIIVSATGVKQTYYSKFANYLCSKGMIVYTFDYGGIGASRQTPLTEFDTTAYSWGANDLEEVIRFVKREHPTKKITLVGHSIGGQLIGLATLSGAVENVVLVAAQSGYWKYWEGFSRLKMIINWYLLFPVFVKLFGYFPGKRLGIMEDLPKGVALEWRKWCVSKNYMFENLAQEKIFHDKLKCSIFSYSVSDDSYAPESAVDWLTNKYVNAQITRRHLVPESFNRRKIGHFGFFKSENESGIWELMVSDILGNQNAE